MSSPSMVHRSGDSLVVRSVVSGNALFEDGKEAVTASKKEEEVGEGEEDEEEEEEEDLLPQCKIKRNYSCPHCSYYTQNPRSYLYHLRDDHGEKIKVYECPSCLYASKHSQKLQRHVHMVHVIGRRGGSGADSGGRKKTAANMAASWTNNVEATSKSSMLHKKKQPKSGGNNVIVASERNEDISGNGEGVRECSVCSFTSSNPVEVARHERTAHLKKKFYRCSKCNYVTHMKARYTKHVKYHSMPMIKCDLCDFRTPYKWNLDRHYKNHTGDGAYRCALCNFTADIKQSLTVHEMNHHVPPVGQGAIVAAAAGGGGGGGARRRNKVGASDSLQQEEIDQEELELLRMEREDTAEGSEPEEERNNKIHGQEITKANKSRKGLSNGNIDTVITSAARQTSKVKVTVKKAKSVSNQEQNERHNFQTDFIHPDDIIHHKNGNVYIKTLRCRMCNYKAAWEGEMARHESKAHGIGRPKPAVPSNKKIPRPVPNLIPIQNKVANPNNINHPGLPILRIPSVRNRAPNSVLKPQSPPENCLSEQDLNEICAKSCPNSSLKDFASVIGGEEVFRTTEEVTDVVNVDNTGKISPFKDEEVTTTEESTAKPASPPPTDVFKRKNASFFDKLKEKLLVGAGESCNLICTYCGHESKCLSELARHQKLHIGSAGRSLVLSSTRCQHCRQRCKTSADLMVHLQSCSEANKSIASIDPHEEEEEEDGEQESKDDEHQSSKYKINGEEPEGEEEDGGELKQILEEEPHPMENKVFVWNNLPEEQGSPDEGDHSSEGSLVGVETAPGYGAVTNKMPPDTEEVEPPEVDPKVALTVKKVFKCPHCSFWASTASRFHVHIVGHLNKKPFECSLCAYRSNWRWDITKHIRLKSARDVGHERARVLMTDETGRRNYSKYNKYLTLMRVHEPSAESSGSGRRTKALEGLTPQPLKVMQLPAPPRLTRAPTPVPSSTPPVGPLRPPPPLRAAHQVVFPGPPPLQPQPQVAKKRPAGDEPEGLPQQKKPNVDNKKTLWKCKKCNFRDASRELVLAHVKEHYQQRQQQQQLQQQSQQQLHQQELQEEQQQQLQHSDDPHIDGDDEASVIWGQAPFRCGHCLQRHCRLKHSGDVRVVIGLKDGGTMEESFTIDDSDHVQGTELAEEDAAAVCDKCPYTTDSATEMSAHRGQHQSRPGAIFKCYFCPFYVSLKRDLLQHMKLHGVNEPEDYISKALHAAKSPIKTEEGGRQHHSIETSPHKRYKCFGCPYVSNSKSQFLYHKQFHRPRTSQFKCSLCSYNVSRRHLLHQHLRVHGILVPPQKSPSKSGMGTDNDGDGTDIEEITELPALVPSFSQNNFPALDTCHLRDIPLVWVSRSGNFCKMFKCRYCPHVNARKANIQEHEKMHRARDTDHSSSGDAIPKEGSQQQQFHCPDCNYVCNNAGVLSSHAKVHQGLYGQVHCLVDTTRSDEVQLQELNASMNKEENEAGIEIREAEEETMDFQLENATESSPQIRIAEESELKNTSVEEKKVIHFCKYCPARFLFEKELNIHTRFHEIRLAYRCESCSYTARQRPHLLAHLRVHTDEYQQRTNSLTEAYLTSSAHPRPKSAVIVDGPGVIGPVWVVIGSGTDSDKSSISAEVAPSASSGRPIVKQYSCHLCPAKFFKSMALQYHITLHGGSGPHKCRQCDYAVKTYGNLVKHEMIHKSSSSGKKPKSNTGSSMTTIPLSGTELFQQRTEAQKQSIAEKKSYTESLPLHVDPQFGILMHGNPDFIYPTYFKNGRLKEKRYKCHKCPSAFEKREQYKVHLSLHGSRQRYRCEKCDYSVKYYANYIQHMRKHKNNEEAQEARKLERGGKDEVEETKEDDEGAEDSSAVEDEPVVPSTRTVKTIGSTHHGPLQLSTADQQTLLLMQKRQENANACGSQDGINSEERRSFRCPHCPYTSPRRDGVESHIKRHLVVSGVRGTFVCSHCDYTVPQLHFLREHNKLHFTRSKKLQPDIYMKYERLELWVADEGKENINNNVSLESCGKRLLFRDSGVDVECDERFLPPLSPTECTPEEEKIYVDPRTGETVSSFKPDAVEPPCLELESKDKSEKENIDDKVCTTENVLAVAEDAKSESGSSSSSSTSSSSSSSSTCSSSSSNSSGTNSSSNSSSSSGSTTTTSTSGESDSESEGAPAVVDDASSTCSTN